MDPSPSETSSRSRRTRAKRFAPCPSYAFVSSCSTKRPVAAKRSANDGTLLGRSRAPYFLCLHLSFLTLRRKRSKRIVALRLEGGEGERLARSRRFVGVCSKRASCSSYSLTRGFFIFSYPCRLLFAFFRFATMRSRSQPSREIVEARKIDAFGAPESGSERARKTSSRIPKDENKEASLDDLASKRFLFDETERKASEFDTLRFLRARSVRASRYDVDVDVDVSSETRGCHSPLDVVFAREAHTPRARRRASNACLVPNVHASRSYARTRAKRGKGASRCLRGERMDPRRKPPAETKLPTRKKRFRHGTRDNCVASFYIAPSG